MKTIRVQAIIPNSTAVSGLLHDIALTLTFRPILSLIQPNAAFSVPGPFRRQGRTQLAQDDTEECHRADELGIVGVCECIRIDVVS